MTEAQRLELEWLKARVEELEGLLALAQRQLLETNKEIATLAVIMGEPDANS